MTRVYKYILIGASLYQRHKYGDVMKNKYLIITSLLLSLFAQPLFSATQIFFTRGKEGQSSYDHSLNTLGNYSTTSPQASSNYYATSTPSALPAKGSRLCIGAYSGYAGGSYADEGYIQLNEDITISCLDISAEFGGTTTGIAKGISGEGTIYINQIDGSESIRQQFTNYAYVDFDIGVNVAIDTSSYSNNAMFWRPEKTLTFSGDTVSIAGTNTYNLYFAYTDANNPRSSNLIFDTRLIVSAKALTQSPSLGDGCKWIVSMRGTQDNDISTGYVVRKTGSELNLEKSGGAKAFNAGSTLVISEGGTVNVNGVGQMDKGSNLYMGNSVSFLNLNGNSLEVGKFGLISTEPFTNYFVDGAVSACIDFGEGGSTFKFESFDTSDSSVVWSIAAIQISNFDAETDRFLSGEKLSEIIVEEVTEMSAKDLLIFQGHEGEVYECEIDIDGDVYYAYSYAPIPESSFVAVLAGLAGLAFVLGWRCRKNAL